ncbi:MAG TPA: hypothetical protein VGQ83_21775, partial [Polyangia bacterium]
MRSCVVAPSEDDPTPADFIARVRRQNQAQHDTEAGRAALRDLQQTFTDHWAYVAELVQNAVDAHARRLRFVPDPTGAALVFEHDGDEFSPADVTHLCARGLTHKGVGTFGFMGLGFKSVFRDQIRLAKLREAGLHDEDRLLVRACNLRDAILSSLGESQRLEELPRPVPLKVPDELVDKTPLGVTDDLAVSVATLVDGVV